MPEFTGFTAEDFDLFAVPTLEERMELIKAGPRPKLEALGRDLAPALTEVVGHPLYPTVAKHARRKVNPPDHTWVAWSANKRGYKMLPHFQVGLWQTHAFIQAGVIYEAQARPLFAQNLLANLDTIKKAIPGHFRWLEDYMQPEGIPHSKMTDADFQRIADRLIHRKEADCMVGLSVDRADVIRLGPAFADMALGVLKELVPIYLMGHDPAII